MKRKEPTKLPPDVKLPLLLCFVCENGCHAISANVHLLRRDLQTADNKNEVFAQPQYRSQWRYEAQLKKAKILPA